MKLDQNKIKELMEGVEISDGAIKGLVALIEGYVVSENGATTQRLKKHYESKLNQITESAEKYGKYVQEEMSGKITEYTTYAVKEFIKENQVKLNKLENLERMEACFEAVKHAFEYNGFKLDESAEVATLKNELTEAKNSFNDIFTQYTGANDELGVAKQAIMFEGLVKDLTSTQKNKVRKLAESISFDDLKEFKQGVTLIVENVKRDVKTDVTPSPTEVALLKENTTPVVNPTETTKTPQMAAILAAMKR
jgi:hypothetical protein